MHKCFLCNYFIKLVKRKKRKKGSRLRFKKNIDIESNRYIFRRFDKKRNEDNKNKYIHKNVLTSSNEFNILNNENEMLLLSSNGCSNMINLNNSSGHPCSSDNISKKCPSENINVNDHIINNNIIYCKRIHNDIREMENIYIEGDDELYVPVDVYKINKDLCDIQKDIINEYNVKTNYLIDNDFCHILTFCKLKKIKQDLIHLLHFMYLYISINNKTSKNNFHISNLFKRYLKLYMKKNIKAKKRMNHDMIDYIKDIYNKYNKYNLYNIYNKYNIHNKYNLYNIYNLYNLCFIKNNNGDNYMYPLKKKNNFLNNISRIQKYFLFYKSYKMINIMYKIHFLCFRNFCFNINRKDYFYKNILYQMKKKKCAYIYRQIQQIYIDIINIVKLKRVEKKYMRKKSLFTINYSNITNQMRYKILRNKYINIVIWLSRIFFKYLQNVLLCNKNMFKRYMCYKKLKQKYCSYNYNINKNDIIIEKRLIKNICSNYFNYIKNKESVLFNMKQGRYKNKPHKKNQGDLININNLNNEKTQFFHVNNMDNLYKNKINENIFILGSRQSRNKQKDDIWKKKINTYKRRYKGKSIKYLYCKLKNNPDTMNIRKSNKMKRPYKYKIKKRIKKVHCHNNFLEHLYKPIERNIGHYKNKYFTTMNRDYLMKRKLKEHRVRIRKKYIEDIEPNVKKKETPLYGNEHINQKRDVHINQKRDVHINQKSDVHINQKSDVHINQKICEHINNSTNHINNLGVIPQQLEDARKPNDDSFLDIGDAERCDMISRDKEDDDNNNKDVIKINTTHLNIDVKKNYIMNSKTEIMFRVNCEKYSKRSNSNDVIKDVNIKNGLTDIIYVDDKDRIGDDVENVNNINKDFKEKYKIIMDVLKLLDVSKDNNKDKNVNYNEYRNEKISGDIYNKDNYNYNYNPILNRENRFIEYLENCDDIKNNYDMITLIKDNSSNFVYKCYDKKMNRYVAIKCVNKEKQLSIMSYNTYVNIYKIIQRINNENVVKIYDLLENKLHFFIVMELCEGIDLVDYVSKENISYEKTKSIICQLLNGIYALHSNYVIHRDIKLDNLMFKDKNLETLVIVDFDMSVYIYNDSEMNAIYHTCGTQNINTMYPMNVTENIHEINELYDIRDKHMNMLRSMTKEQFYEEKFINMNTVQLKGLHDNIRDDHDYYIMNKQQQQHNNNNNNNNNIVCEKMGGQNYQAMISKKYEYSQYPKDTKDTKDTNFEKDNLITNNLYSNKTNKNRIDKNYDDKKNMMKMLPFTENYMKGNKNNKKTTSLNYKYINSIGRNLCAWTGNTEKTFIHDGEKVIYNDLIIGTKEYMSPYCLKGIYSIRTDIYSIGVTIYLILFKNFPYLFDEMSIRKWEHFVISKNKNIVIPFSFLFHNINCSYFIKLIDIHLINNNIYFTKNSYLLDNKFKELEKIENIKFDFNQFRINVNNIYLIEILKKSLSLEINEQYATVSEIMENKFFA
ncbi:serine/threonine protein kinase,putative [Plasmodium sp. gorilla clade G2]|uniref:serine/threonine protein kinase,putative n=1 Tax=Plasmodium sp. gorilla clade G2 TaxID=880535 RepID=UPI000D205B76|nr:serine/threonine protein kinase,putative [Plasmodium sp. gorilla clade G2]SOV12799.1 serine/threonine protein kinase,putative [Plasmodium sp. gorilla clade G2]